MSYIRNLTGIRILALEMPSDRKNDYEFDQKYYQVTQSELTISLVIKLIICRQRLKNTAYGSFEGYVNKGKKVFTKTIMISKPILKKADFEGWNAFIADINKFYNDQVVLTK